MDRQEQKCEVCEQYRSDAFRRAEHGKVACNGCHQDIMRADSPTSVVRRPVLETVPAWMREA